MDKKLPELQQAIIDELRGEYCSNKFEPSLVLLKLGAGSFSMISIKSGVRLHDVNWRSVQALERRGLVRAGSRVIEGRWAGATRYELVNKEIEAK